MSETFMPATFVFTRLPALRSAVGVVGPKTARRQSADSTVELVTKNPAGSRVAVAAVGAAVALVAAVTLGAVGAVGAPGRPWHRGR